MKRTTLGVLLALLFLPGTSRRAVTAGIRGLPSPEHVSPEAQNALKARMGRHAATMQELVRAVVLLDRPTIRVLAGRIADDDLAARLSDPATQSLPRELFREQGNLSEAARELVAAAADNSEDRVLAERFSALTKTCVTCHSVYLHARPEPKPTGPGAK